MEKETAAQRVERIKKEKNGLDVIEDIKQYANLEKELDPEDIDRFKWYGLYTQNRNLQDEDDETLYFMLRVKLINGELNLKQLKTIATISKEFAKNSADFTTRQDIQFHFIKIVDLPEIFKRLQEVGLSTVFAAGDVPRNVVTCPVNGIDHEQITDVNELVKEVNDYFHANRDLSNLPRKYKVAISGCNKHCISHEINDLSFSATKIVNKILYDVHIGGGLASNKQIAQHLGYIEASQILPTVKAVSKMYNKYGFRDNRRKARLGHVLKEWGKDKFLEVLHENLDFKLKEKQIQEFTSYNKREHFGIHKNTKDGFSYIGCAIDSGNIGAKGLFDLHELLKKYEVTTIKATISQNFIIQDVPTKNAQALANELKKIGIFAFPSTFKARALACTGLKFCKFAISETKDLAKEIVTHLETKFPNFKEEISISVNGCPNSCAHPWVVDIGLLGCKVKENDETLSGFELLLGGNLQGVKSQFAQKSGIKFPSSKAKEVLEELISNYIKSNSSSLREFLTKQVNVKQQSI